MNLIYRYRVKSLAGELNRQARAINFVWNFLNDRQRDAVKWDRMWPSAYDLEMLTAGSSRSLGISAETISQLCRRYVQSRKNSGRRYLRYRGRKSLGWVPVKGCAIRADGDGFRFLGKTYRVFCSRPLPEGKIRDGSSFSQDARGNWYLSIVIEVPDAKPREIQTAVGIDLGLKDFAVLSNGEAVPNPRNFRAIEDRLAKAQRARKKRTAAKLHAKAMNSRRDFLHKLSHRIAREFDHIAVGNVNAAGLAKTSMAKSVNDAGWSSFRLMLRYKAITHGVRYVETDERFTTQVCSDCGAVSGPKGIAHLGIRHWICGDCGASHDRDVNSALNILARSGHRAPVVGTVAT